METYTLIVLAALFLGVMGIIAMMDQRRRTDLAHAEQLNQTLTNCMGWLQAIHSSGEVQMGKIAETLAQLRTAIETGTKSSSESAATISSETIRIVEQAASRLETAVQQHQKALDTNMIRAADKISESSAARTNDLLSEAQRMTKAVQNLQASMEASAKF